MIFYVHFATYVLKNKSRKYVLIFNAIFSHEHVYSFFILISVLISMVEYIDLTFPTEYAYYKYIYMQLDFICYILFRTLLIML